VLLVLLVLESTNGVQFYISTIAKSEEAL